MNDALCNWTLDVLLEPMSLPAIPAVQILGISLDSRLVEPGDLYLAVAGKSTHGIRFAKPAIEAGAVAMLVAPEIETQFQDSIEALRADGFTVVAVPELDSRCADIAERFYDKPDSKMTLIAVTGTDGKTSVCRFITSALNSIDKPCGYVGTLGWGMSESLQPTDLTTPDVVSLRRMLALMYQQGARYVALEASSHGLSEGRLDGLQLDVAVLTNLGRDHLDYHVTVEAYRAAKARLFHWQELKAVVLNGCDSMGRELAATVKDVEQLIYCSNSNCIDSLPGSPSTIIASNIVTRDSGIDFTIEESGELHSVATRLLGRFNVDNLLACYASIRACGIAANDAIHVLQSVPPVPGRMERLGSGAQPTVVIDFCHTPQALTVAIESVRVHCVGQLWVVFGCGGDRDTGKRAPMARAAEAADHIVLTDDNPRTESSAKIIEDTLKGFVDKARVTIIADRASAIRHAVTNACADDLILIAGKGHENYQIVGSTRLPFSDRDQALAALELVS